MFKHADIWRAIDRLAEKNGFSASGLALKAGLSATVFNPSKRAGKDRKRWPSTESIAAILAATGASFDDFIALMHDGVAPRSALPLLPEGDVAEADRFDEEGKPVGAGWDEMPVPASGDARAFAIEVTGKNFEPVYREGDRLIISPAEKPRRGDRVAVRTKKGEIILRKLGREGGQKVELVPLRFAEGAEPPETYARRDIDWIYRIVWASQ